MSKAALILGNLGDSKSDVVKTARSNLGLEVGKILELAGSGRPLVVRKLFDRAEPKFASGLQVVLADLEKLGVAYEAYELLDHQEFTHAEKVKLFRLDATKLQNMIAAHEESIRQQIELAALQDGDE
ncbi:MAG: hypothetical protein J0M26_27970 [Planctomycetes bacterium]|nr:hypothetical protein [Planctomycetota bacterium]